MPTDTSEKGLETLIMRHMTGGDGFPADGGAGIEDTPDDIAAEKAGGSGWHAGQPSASWVETGTLHGKAPGSGAVPQQIVSPQTASPRSA